MTSRVCWKCGVDHREGEPCPNERDRRIDTLLDGKYEIVRVLGAGGMGKVYEARHKEIGRRVAVKFLLPEFAAHPEVTRRFKNEARAAGKLDHENIAAVHDIGQAIDGSSYLVMDYLDGHDCENLLAREGPLPVPRVIGLILQVCRGLQAAHAAGIVHRDLKPANLYIVKRADRTDWIKILDFGIAKLRSSEETADTATGLAMGTAHYMSPEQARGDKSVDQRTDVYALGVILYELLSGKKPHTGDSYLEIIFSILHTEPAPLESLRKGLPAALVSVVRKAMCMDLDRRYPTVADLAEALVPFAGAPIAPFRSQMVNAATSDPGAQTQASGSNSADGSAIGSRKAGAAESSLARGARKTGGPLGGGRTSWLAWGVGLTMAVVVTATVAVWATRTKPSDTAVRAANLVSVPPMTRSTPASAQTLQPAPALQSALASHPAPDAVPSGHRERPDSSAIATAPSAAPSLNRASPKPPVPAAQAAKVAKKTANPETLADVKAPGPGALDINREPNF